MLAFAGADSALPNAADVKRHEEMKLFIGVRGEAERRETAFRDVDTQLLLQLADEGGFRRFALAQLAAGKFPQAFEMLARRPLSNQHPTVRIDQGDHGN